MRGRGEGACERGRLNWVVEREGILETFDDGCICGCDCLSGGGDDVKEEGSDAEI